MNHPRLASCSPDARFFRYFAPEDALASLRYISGTKLDERIIRADLDPGYREGRQYGRGKSGGQVRDEMRDYFDPGRGDGVVAGDGA